MIITAAIALCALLGLLFLIGAARRWRRRRYMPAGAHAAAAILLFLLGVLVLFVGANLRTYERLSFEQPAAELQLTRVGERLFNARLSYRDGRQADFALRGDEWQADARVLKWHAFANLAGFDTVYRLDRISGRYSRIEDERALPRTVYALTAPDSLDVWQWVRRHHSWLPFTDALYGSATFLPMADGALYEISVSQSGLLARPSNQAARDAVGSWR